MTTLTHEQAMRVAWQEAQKGLEKGEVPVGAVVVCENKIIAKAHNQTELLHDSTAHAEMVAMTSAMSSLQSKYLPNCTLYVTLEPCLMCAGAACWAQLGAVVIGAKDTQRGFSQWGNNILHPKTEIIWNVLSKDCEDLIHLFFKNIRKK